MVLVDGRWDDDVVGRAAASSMLYNTSSTTLAVVGRCSSSISSEDCAINLDEVGGLQAANTASCITS